MNDTGPNGAPWGKTSHIIVRTVLALGLLAVALFHEQVLAYLPSAFRSALPGQGLLYWHPFMPVSVYEYAYIFFALAIAGMLLFYAVESFQHIKDKHAERKLSLLGLFAVLLTGAALLYSDIFSGFALYNDRIVVKSAFRDLAAQTYRPDDIAAVEIGCHERITLTKRSRNHWFVPSYSLVLKSGRVVPLMDAADDDYLNPALLSAVGQLDAEVRRLQVPRRYRKYFLDNAMTDPKCIARLESRIAPENLRQLRRVFGL